MKKYRFFYHYNRTNKKMSVHFRGTCSIVQNVVCWVPSSSYWNTKTQPNLVMRGFAEEVIIKNDLATIK